MIQHRNPRSATRRSVSLSFLAALSLSWISLCTCDASILSHTSTDPSSFHLVLKVLTCNRAGSLNRLFESLIAADYAGNQVDVDIYIDYPPPSTDPKKMQDSHNGQEAVVQAARELAWPHGVKRVHERIRNVGVIGQWVEAWSPASDTEYALFVEDDMEVSPAYYAYIRAAVNHFRPPTLVAGERAGRARALFGPHRPAGDGVAPAAGDASAAEVGPHFHRLFGLSLQRLQLISGIKEPRGTLPIRNGDEPFAYQLTGTWGQLFFPTPWLEFRDWFRSARRTPGFAPFVDGLIHSRWYKNVGDNAWEQWVVRWAHDTGRFSVYTNLPARRCLATNHREIGNNFHSRQGADCKLVKRKTRDLFVFPKTMQFYNFSLIQIDPETLPPINSDKQPN
eukprot:TRINITY_DN6012_c0_g1_i1.p1 TRINITY_DN6012_c0_g1~~TRINITY_DN6012_c0_g1_i1.p1  ORF type:complete len:393 (+),score=68.31 TRINITY_DN6012_c0_g1_i1:70-1248(+)